MGNGDFQIDGILEELGVRPGSTLIDTEATSTVEVVKTGLMDLGVWASTLGIRIIPTFDGGHSGSLADHGIAPDTMASHLGFCTLFSNCDCSTIRFGSDAKAEEDFYVETLFGSDSLRRKEVPVDASASAPCPRNTDDSYSTTASPEMDRTCGGSPVYLYSSGQLTDKRGELACGRSSSIADNGVEYDN